MLLNNDGLVIHSQEPIPKTIPSQRSCALICISDTHCSSVPTIQNAVRFLSTFPLQRQHLLEFSISVL